MSLLKLKNLPSELPDSTMIMMETDGHNMAYLSSVKIGWSDYERFVPDERADSELEPSISFDEQDGTPYKRHFQNGNMFFRTVLLSGS
jgi:hypothetical protein